MAGARGYGTGRHGAGRGKEAAARRRAMGWLPSRRAQGRRKSQPGGGVELKHPRNNGAGPNTAFNRVEMRVEFPQALEFAAQVGEPVAACGKVPHNEGQLLKEVVEGGDLMGQAMELRREGVALGGVVDGGVGPDKPGEMDTIEGRLNAFVVEQGAEPGLRATLFADKEHVEEGDGCTMNGEVGMGLGFQGKLRGIDTMEAKERVRCSEEVAYVRVVNGEEVIEEAKGELKPVQDGGVLYVLG